MNWKSFAFGFVAGVALLSAISHWRARPQNVIASWPDDDNKKGMQMIAPWITKARVAKLGAFAAFVPSDSSQKTEAIIHPIKTGFPKVNISNSGVVPGPTISLIDSKNRLITVNFSEPTGEFISYDYSPNMITGTSFIDANLDGEYDVKVGPASNLAVNYMEKWHSVTRKDKKRYIEVDGELKEIEMKDFRWNFVGK